MSHAPVMLDEALVALNPRDGGLYVDATFGAGGYSRAILSAADCRVLALDRDPTVRFAGEQVKTLFPGRFVLVETPFSNMEHVVREAGGEHVDGVVMDVGVSSMQLDQAERGFSFAKPGPLDMRMGGDGPTAADAVNALARDELADIFFNYGEEKRSRRVAEAILKARKEAPIETTERLAAIVEKAIGGGHQKIHPATRVFQALRIFVNDELGELERALAAAERLLRPGGHLVAVTFHSLEDRIVKSFMRKRAGLEAQGSRHMPQVQGGPEPSFKMLFMGAKTASEEEVAENRRARSAKLRAAVRTDADPFPESDQTPSFERLTPEALL